MLGISYVYAPSTGIVPSFHEVMTVPSQWEDDFVFDHLEEDDEEWDEWTPNDDDAFDFESWNYAVTDYASSQ